jgi:hypothetical protein
METSGVPNPESILFGIVLAVPVGKVAFVNCIYMENPPFGRDSIDIGEFQPNFTLYNPLLEMFMISGDNATTCRNDKGKLLFFKVLLLSDGVLAKTGEWNENPKDRMSNPDISNAGLICILCWRANKL